MPTLIPEDYAEVAIELRATGDPSPWYVTHGIRTTDFTGDTAALGSFVLAAFTGAWLSRLSDIVRVTGVNITKGTGLAPIRQFVNNPVAGQGASTQAKLPQNCALLIRKNSTLGGRRNRGRCYLPLILDEQGVDNIGTIASSSVTAYQTQADLWWSELQEEGPQGPAPMVILHSTEGVSSPGLPTVVSSMTVDGVIATQRRRLR